MIDKETMTEVLDACEERRAARRAFLRASANASLMTGGLAMLAACGDDDDDISPTPPPTGTPGPTPGPTPPVSQDPAILNFALNLEYLEAQFYVFATTGAGLPASSLSGTGTRGEATGGRQVNFAVPIVAQYAREIAADERAHVEFLRRALGSAAVAQPAIDIGVGPNNAFSNAARAAGLITGPTSSFDVYANDDNFLLGAFIFEDVGVTAYAGAARLITDKGILEQAAGILAAEAYHAGLVRTVLYARGVPTPSLRTATDRISDARDGLDGTGTDRDQGVSPTGGTSNIVPADANGLTFLRSAPDVLNIVYLNRAAVTMGGFFPNGVNGTIRTSGAN